MKKRFERKSSNLFYAEDLSGLFADLLVQVAE